ncbi:lipase family alpha/beta hydrolase [Sporichthya polymorpha]|uniref:lipase family alpha/beta hydrolase n=1 Tax=Sporichthya polymorpha TaxID=35751 RepID=UPI000380141C|nr:alpha/beta hydrolase [Sporichthya polymorpha]
MRRSLAAGLLSAALLVGALPAPAAAVPADTGPALSVDKSKLIAALKCNGGEAGRTPVLLVPGTTLNPELNFDWNWTQAFLLEKRAFCSIELPEQAMADVQVAAEYVVFAIRTMRARTGGKISVIGHSQGGMIGRWALKFWPDTRRMVDDLIGLAPSNHGTQAANVLCNPDCAPAIWQQREGSEFNRVLDDGPETWSGISYTVLYTSTDGVIVPPENSRLTTGQGEIANVLLSDACPGHLSDHLAIGTYDAVSHALALDALDHPGPARVDRFDRAACTEPTQPGVNRQFMAVHYTRMVAAIAGTIAGTPHVSAEPELAPYAR